MGRGYPGLSERTLNLVRNIVRERQRVIDRGEGQVAEQNQSKNMYAFGYRHGGRHHEPREAGRKTLETGEDKERNPPVKLSNGTWSCLHITFSLVQLLLDICLPKTGRVNLCYFKPISFVVVICYRGK